MAGRSIQARGGLEVHHERMGLDHGLFVLMAEANWDREQRQYIGIRSMARVLGTTDTTIIKHLHVYDAEIGRERNVKNK